VKKILHSALCLPLLAIFACVATAQDPQGSAPLVLSELPVCRGKKDKTPGCVIRPRALSTPDPTYPESERHARHVGIVKLELVVGSDGLPHDITVSRSLNPDFDAAAIDAVKKWKFSPAIRDDKPIAVLIPVEVSFQLFR
jgi:TonB family protein